MSVFPVPLSQSTRNHRRRKIYCWSRPLLVAVISLALASFLYGLKNVLEFYMWTRLLHLRGRTPLVTFVIPSLGRSSLETALYSLQAQTVDDWRAVVILPHASMRTRAYSNVSLAFRYLTDHRIRFLTFNLRRISNCAGLVRNLAISQARTSWIALLDDDDSVSPSYVQELKEEIFDNPGVDLVIFRMYDHRGVGSERYIPHPDMEDIRLNFVGISFAYKRTFTKLDNFIDATQEDYFFLQKFCFKTDRWCLLSSAVTYFVKGVEPSKVEARPRMRKVKKIAAFPSETFELDYLSSM